MNDTKCKPLERKGFDIILGNPPFVNAIEGGIAPATKQFAKLLFPDMGGTADLSYYFVDKSVQLADSHGRVGLIQPRVILNATPANELRSRLTQGPLRPNAIYAPNRSDFFPGAAVFVCALVIGPDEDCRVSRDDDPQSSNWQQGKIAEDNWWLAIGRIADGLPPSEKNGGPTVGDLFEVAASMTTGDAYDVVPFVVNEESGQGLKLITTGLIDPGECLWGKETCRYLKKDYRFPRVSEGDDMSNSLRRRLANAHRPKVLVAGLAKRIECFLDSTGECVGAVSTYSIFHADNDIELLQRLQTHLSSDDATARFKAELGGNAMGGGNTTMRKEFLERLSAPIDQGLARTEGAQ